MSDATTYTFKIEDFTPKSMPFGRLVEYYREIGSDDDEAKFNEKLCKLMKQKPDDKTDTSDD